jgi:hypothetical protein
MFSGYPFSTQPFLASGREVRAYLDLRVDLDASFAFTIYVTTRAGYATRPTDRLANQPFRGVLESYSCQRSILQQDIGTFATCTGRLVISNTDAHYDFLQYGYTINARPVNLSIGRVDASHDDVFTLARLTSTGWNVRVDQVLVDLVDYSYRLDVTMQPNVYGGTGGADGGADIAGKRKQMLFGYCRNVSMLAVWPALLIFQANDGPMQAVVAVRDRGSPLLFYADFANFDALSHASVPAGYYATCLAKGFIRLGADPNGTVTADVRGINAQGYITTTADIARWAIRNRTVIIDPDGLDTGSFDRLNELQPAAIDYCISPDDSLTVAAFIANIMHGVGGWGGHLRNGLFQVRIFAAPTGNAVASFSRKDMISGDIIREPLPSSYLPPPWRWRVPYARSWTVQTDLDAAVSADHKAFVSEQFRVAEASNPAVKVDYPFAQDRDPVLAYFSYLPDAQAEAARRLALFGSTRSIYRQTLPRRALRLNMGDEIKITHERFDLSQGKYMIVVDVNENITFTDASSVDSVQVATCG